MQKQASKTVYRLLSFCPRVKTASVLTLAAAAVVLSGCARLERGLYSQNVTAEPGRVIATNYVTQTNVVEVPATATTPATQKVVVQTNVVYETAPTTYTTNLVPRTAVTSLIGAGEALPIPGAGVLAGLLGWAYTAYAAVRNRRIGLALVDGIEAGRKIILATPGGAAVDDQFKDALIARQEAGGVLNAVSRMVNNNTENTK